MAALAPDGWFTTGDLGKMTREGRLVISGGRLGDMIIRGGENVYPVEIENLLRGHPSVTDVAVFGMPDNYHGEIVAAAVIAREAIDSAAPLDYCRDCIARFKIPARCFAVVQFPLTANGKVKKVELRNLAISGKLRDL